MKNRFLPVLAVLFALLLPAAFAIGCAAAPAKEYGVFLGIGGTQIERLDGYRFVVVEPSEFSQQQIEALHRAGTTVYAYLNIGAVEEYRPYYRRFQALTLGVYKDWPDERWVDVSSPVWQRFVVDELGTRYAEMGFDGFFLDNADVFYHYPTEVVFEGLCAILNGLKACRLPLILNGGDTFVARCIEENIARSLFDGINQETVFTKIDFQNSTYGEQSETDKAYFQAYLAKAKECGLSVFLLEYRADPTLSKQIDAYCAKNGFLWYNAEDLELR